MGLVLYDDANGSCRVDPRPDDEQELYRCCISRSFCCCRLLIYCCEGITWNFAGSNHLCREFYSMN